MKFELRPARRGDLFTRLLIFGESGQGKTYTALSIAFHLADLYGIHPSQIAVLDTETVESPDRSDNATGSAEKYAGRPCNCNRCLRQGLTIKGAPDGFQTMIMEDGHRGPEAFLRALEVCKAAGIKIVILDGITSEWRALLQLVDKVNAQTRGKGDGWSTARPLHNQFVQALLEYPGHVISTCRAKKDSRHKKAEEGLGDVMPDQDSNVIYEYDVALFVKRGTGYVVKTRDDRLENSSSRHPGADLAEGLKRWCDDPAAKTRSAQATAAIANPRNPLPEHMLPDVAPNTRTDADPARVASGQGGEHSSPANSTPAGNGNGGGEQVDVGALIATAEGNIRYLRELGQGEVAEQSQGYLAIPTNRVARGVSQLIARQEHVIKQAEEHAAAQAAREPAAAVADDPTEGYDDLPF